MCLFVCLFVLSSMEGVDIDGLATGEEIVPSMMSNIYINKQTNKQTHKKN